MEADLNTKLTVDRRADASRFVTVILAMSADGKIGDSSRTAARFGSAQDKAHLEEQIAQADGVLFGASTLRAYGTTLRVRQPELLHQRCQQEKAPQPVHIVCSRSAAIDPNIPFFRQPVPRWLLTTAAGAHQWQSGEAFEQILIAETRTEAIDWDTAFQTFSTMGLTRFSVLGGGALVASLFEADLVDELWLTVCPLILGGDRAPTPVDGTGFLADLAPQLQLLEARSLNDEVFLHYRVKHSSASSQD